MTARTRMILAIVGALVLCLLFYFFFIRPRSAELTRVEGEVETEQARTVQLQSELARLQDLQANAPKLEAELAELRRLVPSGDHEIPNFIFLVQAASNASGVEFLQISPQLPGPPPEGAAVAQIDISIIANGSYFSIQDFVRRLYGLSRAVRLDVMDLSVSEGTGTGTSLAMTGSFRIFFEPPAPPAPEPAPGAPAPTDGTTPVATEPPEEG